MSWPRDSNSHTTAQLCYYEYGSKSCKLQRSAENLFAFNRGIAHSTPDRLDTMVHVHVHTLTDTSLISTVHPVKRSTDICIKLHGFANTPIIYNQLRIELDSYSFEDSNYQLFNGFKFSYSHHNSCPRIYREAKKSLIRQIGLQNFIIRFIEKTYYHNEIHGTFNYTNISIFFGKNVLNWVSKIDAIPRTGFFSKRNCWCL